MFDANRKEQMRAAAAHAQSHMMRLANTRAFGNFTVRPVQPWVRDLLTEHNRLIEAGEAKCCAHIDESGPQIQVVALWMIGYVFCDPCVKSGAFRQTGDEEIRCDGCKRVFPEGVKPFMITVGNWLIHGGVCDECSGDHRV